MVGVAISAGFAGDSADGWVALTSEKDSDFFYLVPVVLIPHFVRNHRWVEFDDSVEVTD
jgi:hypothetical protein